MNTIIKRAGSLLAALALVGMANGAQAQDEADLATAPMADSTPMTMNAHSLQDHSVRVGGVVEFIAASTDNGEDGFDRGRFSRIIVDYSNTLDNGLIVSGNISYMVNSRDGTERPWAPDTMFLSAGGGFGTVTMGSHAMAVCSLHVRAYALVPSGWWGGHAGVGFGANGGGWFAEDHGCLVPTAVSYATPTMGGLSAMVSLAPSMDSHQWRNRGDATIGGVTQTADSVGIVDGRPAVIPGTTAAATSSNAENALEAAVRYAASMGAADIAVSLGIQTADDDVMDATVAGAQLSFGGATVAADWFDNARGDGSDGYSIGAKYTLGAISPAISYSSADYDAGGESTYLTVGGTYAVGGGLSVWGEYQDIETTTTGTTADGEDTVMIAGVVVAF